MTIETEKCGDRKVKVKTGAFLSCSSDLGTKGRCILKQLSILQTVGG